MSGAKQKTAGKGVVVFCGPTISPSEVLAVLPRCDVRGPAARGDVAEVARQRPAAIAVVDGYFRQVPAVWHKEILWALSLEIPVFGAASMGALRAAELAPFGMIGVGRIFESYVHGELTGDDEVAVAHASQEHGFKLASDALVDIRQTLRAAANRGILSPASEAALVAAVKALPYEERSMRRLMNLGAPVLARNELAALRDWLPNGQVRQKHQDAVELLERLRLHCVEGWPHVERSFHFEPTDAWLKLQSIVDAKLKTNSENDNLVLDEVVIAGQGRRLSVEGLARALAFNVDPKPDARLTQLAAVEFRSERALEGADAFEGWIEQNDVPDAELDAYFQAEAALRRARLLHGTSLRQCMLDQLRASNEYAALRDRAREKENRLRDLGMNDSTLAQVQINDTQLWRWFFETKFGAAPPDNLYAFAQLHGINTAELRRAALREYCYSVGTPPSD